MTYYHKLASDKCYLSPCHLQDAEKWTQWLNDLEVALPLGMDILAEEFASGFVSRLIAKEG